MALAAIAMLGCTRREDMNFECTWPSDPMFAVDLDDPAALRHLLDDIRMAKELDIRDGDRVAGRTPVSVLSVVFRRGAGADLTLAQRLRSECSANQTFASWNQLDGWLRQIDGLRRPA